jgi:ferrous iron transport protein B
MKSLGLPVIVALNMIDLAERDGVKIDIPKLSALLGAPVVATRATRKAGRESLIAEIDAVLATAKPGAVAVEPTHDLRALQREARRIATETISEPAMNHFTRRLDAVLLHPVAGLVVLLAILFVMFQAVFAWAEPGMDAIEAGFHFLGDLVARLPLPDLLKSFLKSTG